MLEWIPHVAGNINRLNFQRAKITNFAGLVISTKNNINVTSRAAFCILQTNFCQSRPSCACWKKEIRCIICNYPFLTKANWTSDNGFAVVENTAHTERVLSFVFCAVRNFVVKRAKTLCAMAICFGTHVSCRKSENLCKWMKHFCHAMKLKKSLREVNHLTQVLKNSSVFIHAYPWLKLCLIQNFREMDRLEFAALAREQALQVHQAARIV